MRHITDNAATVITLIPLSVLVLGALALWAADRVLGELDRLRRRLRRPGPQPTSHRRRAA